MYLYALPDAAAEVVPRIAAAGVDSLTLQVEAWAFYLSNGQVQAPCNMLAGALAAAIDGARREGIREVGLAVLLGSNVAQLLDELAALGSLPDRLVVQCGYSPTWTYSASCEEQLRDLRLQIDRMGAPCRVAVCGGITMASLPMSVWAGAEEVTILNVDEYSCYGQQQLHCAGRRHAQAKGRIEPHDGEPESWARRGAGHRWGAAARTGQRAANMVREAQQARATGSEPFSA